MTVFIKVNKRFIKQDRLKTINLMERVIYNLQMGKLKMEISKMEISLMKKRLKKKMNKFYYIKKIKFQKITFKQIHKINKNKKLIKQAIKIYNCNNKLMIVPINQYDLSFINNIIL